MVELFLSTLNQMAVLFTFIVIGFLLVKLGCIKEHAAVTLSKLENIVFVPALILGTFIENFTTEKLGLAWKLLLMSFALALICLPIAFAVTKWLYGKDDEKRLRAVATYALNFSNFGFMGNAVVQALFPEIFLEYVIFTIPLWTLAYVWGVPALLIPPKQVENTEEQVGDKTKKSFVSLALSRMKSLVNPMFICVIIGAVIGLSGITLPKFIGQSISSMGACMSPLAMILIGCISTRIDFKKLFTKWKIYTISVIRIIAIPLVFIGIFALLPQNSWLTPTFLKCAIVSLAMPMGVSGVFIPAGYGEDTTPIAEMVLVSHLLSVATIPVMFMLFQSVVV